MTAKQNHMCPSCWKAHKKNGWYISGGDGRTNDTTLCSFHPTMTNWRVIRTLNTLKVWSLENAPFHHKMASALTLTFEGGHIGRRTAEVILFDYEKPFLDLLASEGYIKEHDDYPGVASTMTVTFKGDELLRARLKTKQEKVMSAS